MGVQEGSRSGKAEKSGMFGRSGESGISRRFKRSERLKGTLLETSENFECPDGPKGHEGLMVQKVWEVRKSDKIKAKFQEDLKQYLNKVQKDVDISRTVSGSSSVIGSAMGTVGGILVFTPLGI